MDDIPGYTLTKGITDNLHYLTCDRCFGWWYVHKTEEVADNAFLRHITVHHNKQRCA